MSDHSPVLSVVYDPQARRVSVGVRSPSSEGQDPDPSAWPPELRRKAEGVAVFLLEVEEPLVEQVDRSLVFRA
jgi:hypothetical protein